MNTLSRPMFIVVEGPDGSGKTYTASKLAEYYNGLYVSALGTGPISKAAKAFFISEEGQKANQLQLIDMMIEALIETQELAIKPALAEGKSVFCDRWLPSTFVYQVCKRYQSLCKDPTARLPSYAVEALSAVWQQRFLTSGIDHLIEPDLVVLCEPEIEVIKERLKARKHADDHDVMDLQTTEEIAQKLFYYQVHVAHYAKQVVRYDTNESLNDAIALIGEAK